MKFKLTCKADSGPVVIKANKNTPAQFTFLHTQLFLVRRGLNCIVVSASNNRHGTFGFMNLCRLLLCVKPAKGKPQEKDAHHCSLI